jgi:hypothetical protein
MSENKYSWNETLKFSWGHIIAFVALIFISYVTYMGNFYSNGGDFKLSAIKVFIIDIALILTFIGAQIYKGTDEKFDRSIIIERVLICFCPVAFLWAMIPYNHFWSVFAERNQIEPKFTSAIEKSRQMFGDYDYYSKERITAYSDYLTSLISNKGTNRDAYLKAGFGTSNDELVKDNYVATLKLQLLSQNTDSLRNLALNWINDANQGASVWNAFLVGNLNMISDAIEGWNQKLYEFSVPVLSNESGNSNYSVKPFDQERASFKAANAELISLQNLFENSNGISLNTIITGILLFLMLLFPYFLQKRNTRATGLYSLIPQTRTGDRKKRHNSSNNEYENTDHVETASSHPSDDLYGGTF